MKITQKGHSNIQEIDLIEELIRIKGFDKIELIEPEKKKKQRHIKF